MKIGIVTFFRVPNYGAMLQALALWKYLEALGHEVIFVKQSRFVTKRWLQFVDCFISRSFHSMRAKFCGYVRSPISDFAANYPQTVLCETLDDVRQATASCDAFIVGSDQIWNSAWWPSEDDLRIAMLDFAPEGKPRLSYAVSFGNKDWPTPENARQVGECLRTFTKISVREQSGVDLVRKLSERTDAVCLLDPTLLHTADFYREVIAKASPQCEACATTGSYIFRYVLEWDDVSISERALKAVANKLGTEKIVDVYVPVRGLLAPIAKLLGVTAKISVPEWLSRISHSDFVFTDSFHGTVFSILFHKPFVSLLIRSSLKGMNERILSLLDILGLSDRAVYADEVEKWLPVVTKPIDWEDVEKRLTIWREKTVEFFKLSDLNALERNLSEETKS